MWWCSPPFHVFRWTAVPVPMARLDHLQHWFLMSNFPHRRGHLCLLLPNPLPWMWTIAWTCLIQLAPWRSIYTYIILAFNTIPCGKRTSTAWWMNSALIPNPTRLFKLSRENHRPGIRPTSSRIRKQSRRRNVRAYPMSCYCYLDPIRLRSNSAVYKCSDHNEQGWLKRHLANVWLSSCSWGRHKGNSLGA